MRLYNLHHNSHSDANIRRNSNGENNIRRNSNCDDNPYRDIGGYGGGGGYGYGGVNRDGGRDSMHFVSANFSAFPIAMTIPNVISVVTAKVLALLIIDCATGNL